MPRVPYTKPHLTFADQIAQLEGRGLAVGNRDVAVACLRRIGYYRLSAYWYLFRAPGPAQGNVAQLSDQFRPGYTLQHAVALYEYDKTLRLLLMDAIERIEISVRVETAYYLGSRDPFAHNNPSLMHPNFTKPKNKKANSRSAYDDWKLDEQHHYWRSAERFAEHFASKYELPMPIWISVELWDFGMLSKFFSGMTVADQTYIADYYGVPDWQVMASWFRTLNHARNIAAHHGRLWNRNIDDQPKLPRLGAMPRFDHLVRNQATVTSRVYAILCIILHLLDRIDPAEGWRGRLRSHIDGFPQIPSIDLTHMGFPAAWERQAIWTT